ncbi:hypothetical protein PIROE2DRAFT_9521 [Piromyces sp. E2]|nr:hypothetical protein PIROE2DRAFT_9521 [Piromyces sp. E2]|eukprot:OUM63852.1 hypothetical protein PIROE2DRAFT_9521 [Piromyces sp. E2]
MKIINNIFVFFIISLSFYCIRIYGTEFIIKNNLYDDKYFDSFETIGNNFYEEELVFKFEESYYDFSNLKKINFEFKFNKETKNIYFIGNKNGTIFDFKSGKGGSFFINGINANSIKIENIIFNNYNQRGQNHMYLFAINVIYDTTVYINNCTFQNNDFELIGINTWSNKIKESEPRIIINNCNFYKNSVQLFYTYNTGYSYKLIKFSNCKFIDNGGLFNSFMFEYIFENCNKI